MKFKLTTFVLAIATLCSYWLFADTSIQKFFTSETPFWSTEYWTDGSQTASTTQTLKPNEIYAEDFEGTTNYTFVNADVNKWYIDTVATNGGKRGMYISDDNGITNKYNASLTTVDVSHAVSPSFAVPAGATDYVVSFDWRSVGVGNVASITDALNVWIVPDTYTPTKNLLTNVGNSGGKLVKENMYGQPTFKREFVKLDVSAFAGKSVKLIFEWKNNMFTHTQTPAAIDNVSVFKYTCVEPSGLKVSNIKLDEATVIWTAANATTPNTDVLITTSALYPVNDTGFVNVAGSSSHTFTNLSDSTYYFVWYRTVCSATDKSYWVGPVKFMTTCGVFKTPFSEGFDTFSLNQECWEYKNVNSSAADKYELTTNSSYYRSGDRGLMFRSYAAATVEHDAYAITPTIGLKGGLYKLTYYYKTSPSGNNDFEVLLSTEGKAFDKFSKVIVPLKARQQSSFVKETVFITGITGNVNLAWHVKSKGSFTFQLDDILIESVNCSEPLNMNFTDVKDTSVKLFWQDNISTEWEYAIVNQGNPVGTTGISTTTNPVVATLDQAGLPLVADTQYDYYVRVKCLDGTLGNWYGPVNFKTACLTKAIPYIEGFNSESNDLNCWTILDIEKDVQGASNKWVQSQYTTYEGDRCMSYSAYSPTNNDWLITPGFNLQGGLHAVTFYYKLSKNTKAVVDVKLSTTGTSPEAFTQTIYPTLTYKGEVYTKAVAYIENVTGVVNVGFHVTGTGGSVNIDAFSIDKATCRIPTDLTIGNITTNSVDFSFTDNTNTTWQYYVQPSAFNSLPPVGAGTQSNSTKVTATRINGANTPLVANTEYEVYIRSNCGGSKYSEWVGPVKFRTACNIFIPPFQEGFNSNSSSLPCWKIIDANNDLPAQGTYAIWLPTDYRVFEGDRSMQFLNSGGQNNDDWLMSPLVKLDKTKIYRVTYMHRTEPGVTAEYAVKLSTTGREIADFTQTKIAKKSYDNVPWQQQKFFLTGIDSEISIGFHVTNFTKWGSRIYIDNFKIEEVTSCPEPTVLGATNITGTSADINWDNEFGNTDWEYFVRKKAFLVAPPLSNGTATKTTTVNVTKDNFGANIEGNTWYEFYVRALCADGTKTIWEGPYYFRTACTYSTLPFWEGFNGTDNSLPCWTLLDANKDATAPTGNNIWRQSTSNLFEGSHSMNFNQTSATISSDDYLISPLFKNLDPTKRYRVKFHYMGTGSGTNEMEVVASTTGNAPASFTHVIAPKTSYSTATYKEAIYYTTGLSGDVYFAFKIAGVGAKAITIDNLFIDEVTTCAQPVNPEVKDITDKSATLYWQDDFAATAWQYIILPKKSIKPTNKDAGAPLTQKSNVVTKDHLGNNLEPNTEYMYFVRTDCGNGQFSDWTGPIYFTTSCPIYQVPFEEGFNSNNRQRLCWSTAEGIVDTTKWTAGTTWPYEGDQTMQFNQTTATAKADDYLISPTIQFAAGTNYVLKYMYKTDLTNSNQFEVLLSTNGTNIADFTKTLVSKKAYSNDQYVEEVVFISGVSGNVNIAFHTMTEGRMTLVLDKVTIEKASACAEPANVKVTNFTANTITVEWDQQPGVTQWEVYVAEYGNGLPAGATGTVVSNTPRYTATGLTSGKAYHIYVRAKCPGNTGMSNWSSPVNGPTKMTTNFDCTGALTIPVNPSLDCVQKLGVSTVDAKKFDRTTWTNCMKTADKDLWLEFTATASSHLIEFSNIVGTEKMVSPAISITVYNGACGPNIGASQIVSCYSWESNYGTVSKDAQNTTMNNLVPGQKYYVRVTVQADEYLFNVCITTGTGNYVSVSQNGNLYTTEELVKDILIKSDCDLVSNVKYQAGDKPFGNSLGYFNRNGSTFPFEEGIVLATHNIASVPGPYYDHGDLGGFLGVRGKIPEWEGDADLNAVIASAGGSVYAGNKSVSILEFDFIPVKDTIKFEYLMASESYVHNCTVVCWGAGALFAAWLTEIETGEGQNLAIVPGTNDPITLSTVRDTERSGARCVSVNPEFYGEHYGKGQTNPLLAPINYVGQTKPMSSEPVYVKPGTKYRIKLAVADFCNTNHVSAVFFNAKSFDLGSLDLGADLTIANNTAVCDNESKTIKSGLLTENVEISWLKDDVLIPGANQPDLEVTEAGQYTVVANYPAIKCEIKGTVKVEMFKPLKEIIHPAVDIQYCRNVMGGVVVDLTDSEAGMFKGVNRSNFNVTYYTTQQDAENAENSIDTPKVHSITSSADKQTRYIVVEDLTTGCTEIFTVNLVSAKGEEPKKPADVKVCAVYTFTELPSNQAYYTGPAATGVNYKVGDQIHNPGTYTIYVFQDNGNGCYEETSFTISITEAVVADVLEDKTYSCEVHILAPLSEGNRYFTGPNKTGVELQAGQIVPNPQTIYIYIESEDGLCRDESSFRIDYEECPIPKGISPNGDGYNDTFDLSSNGVTSIKIFNRLGSSVYEFEGSYTNQWYGQNKQGKPLPSGTYYYVVVARGEVKTGWVQLQLQL